MNTEFKSFTNQLFSVKEKGKDFYTTFFLATTHPDNAYNKELGVEGDIITKECLDDLANQWDKLSSARKGSIHHLRGTTIPTMGLPGAEVIPMDKDNYGLLVTAKVNNHFKKDELSGYTKERLISEISEGILDSVSIEYKTLDYDIVEKEGKAYRILNKLDLKGFGHASRPINENAKVLDYAFKELNIEVKSFVEKKQTNEVKKMTDADKKDKEKLDQKKPGEEEKKTEPDTSESVKDDKKTDEEDKKDKEKKEEILEDKEMKNDNVHISKDEYKEFIKLKEKQKSAEIEAKEKEFKEQVDIAVKEALQKHSPLIDGSNHFSDKGVEMKEVVSYKEALKSDDIEMQFKAANALVDKIGFETLFRRSMLKDPQSTQNFEVKGCEIVPKSLEVKEMVAMKGMEFKTLTTSSNAEATYYQAAAELNDIYEPILYNQFNDKTKTYGRLRKISYSDRMKIQFRMGITRNTTAGGYEEDTSTWTSGNQERMKCEQDWALYRVIVQVTGLMIEENRGRGGLGDIWGEEIRRGGKDLLKQINQDILTGDAGTYDGTSTEYLLGFQKIIAETGNLYGKARGTYDALKGNYEAMSSAELTLGQLRKMVRVVTNGGTYGISDAEKSDLLFIFSAVQADKYKQILQSMQRVPVYSKRAGFTDLLEFDQIPILIDPDADDDDVFLVDMNHTKIGIKVAPRLQDLFPEFDGKKGYIKTYFNPYSTKPQNNYWCSGFKTS